MFGFGGGFGGGGFGGYGYQACGSAEQKGLAAEWRTFQPHGSPGWKELSQIVHSGDKNPHKYGPNPYADKTNSYDPKAQKALEKYGADKSKKG